jgi:hypothetical protein
MLSFPEFVEFATATINQRIDIHWQLQDDFATVPGLPLNLIGKVESFQTDFARVLDHIGVTNEARARGGARFSKLPSVSLIRFRRRKQFSDARGRLETALSKPCDVPIALCLGSGR